MTAIALNPATPQIGSRFTRSGKLLSPTRKDFAAHSPPILSRLTNTNRSLLSKIEVILRMLINAITTPKTMKLAGVPIKEIPTVLLNSHSNIPSTPNKKAAIN